MPTVESRPFWERAAQGRLALPRCADCRKLSYPPPPRCPHCLSENLAYEDLSGRGFLRSWTTIVPPGLLPGTPSPFVVAEVNLPEQEGLWMVGLLNTGEWTPREGAEVRVSFSPSSDPSIAYPDFQLIADAP